MELKDRQHLEISQLIDYARELGRTPTAVEYRNKYARHYERAFGNYTIFLSATGLEPTKEKPRRIDGSIFEVSIEKHLENYQPRSIIDRKPYPRIAAISDIHFPFENQRVLESFYRFIEKHQPEHVIGNGDLFDLYSHSRFPRSMNVFTPREEQTLSRNKAETFWKEITIAAPKSKKKLRLGNHSIRPLKHVLDTYPEAEDWVVEGLKKLLTFDGVETIFDYREETMIDDIMIHHGYRSQIGAHRDYTLYNSIVGHTHRGGVVFKKIRGQTLWELNCGYAGDPEAKGLTYTPQKITDWTEGFGFLDEYGPRFVSV